MDIKFEDLGGHYMAFFYADRDVNGCEELLDQLDLG